MNKKSSEPCRQEGLILAIETSCDETAAAVVSLKRKIRSSVVLSQDRLHAPFGGVVPEIASRQHLKTILPVVEEALDRAETKLEEIEVFAVTQGPGLIGSLLVGLCFAKSLAYYFKKPVIGIDHLQAHVESVFLDLAAIPFPALALLVSGGHTSLFLLPARLDYQLLGRTRDDAAGEALDKIAKFLGLGYPGGPVVEKMAEGGDPASFVFAVPKMKDRSLDFSFSGLKTAALKHIREKGLSSSHPDLKNFLASFEEAVVEAVLTSLQLAIDLYQPRAILLCGGVARNRRLRWRFHELGRQVGVEAYSASPEFCTDNAAMVGALAAEKIRRQHQLPSVFQLDAYARSTAFRE